MLETKAQGNCSMRAIDLISPGEKAVAIFTRGDRLKINSDDAGSTGNWRVSVARIRNVSKVILFVEDTQRLVNNVYLGDFRGVEPSDEPGRRIVHFTNMRHVGATDLNWKIFADTNQGPVRYLSIE